MTDEMIEIDRMLYPIERKQILISQWQGYSVQEIAKFFEGYHVTDDLLLKTNIKEKELALKICKDLMQINFYPIHAYPKLMIEKFGVVDYFNIKKFQVTVFDKNLILDYDNMDKVKEIATDISLIPFIVKKTPVVIMKEKKLTNKFITQYECERFEDLRSFYEELYA